MYFASLPWPHTHIAFTFGTNHVGVDAVSHLCHPLLLLSALLLDSMLTVGFSPAGRFLKLLGKSLIPFTKVAQLWVRLHRYWEINFFFLFWSQSILLVAQKWNSWLHNSMRFSLLSFNNGLLSHSRWTSFPWTFGTLSDSSSSSPSTSHFLISFQLSLPSVLSLHKPGTLPGAGMQWVLAFTPSSQWEKNLTPQGDSYISNLLPLHCVRVTRYLGSICNMLHLILRGRVK